MSVIYQRQRRKKKKYPRNRINRKILNKQKLRKKVKKSRGWKLDYPELFEYSDKFPYIIRKKL
ncbi:MAG: hypothetical protein CEE42_13130 [Promethearchaeota archaeon Loki_b31]|nr:MAG: hypothetical protein CEE42_13130 [Candidatus Lokiarchaeota archaeon Loki_b31]